MDVLVNCAGINLYKDPFDYSDEDWDRVVGVDLTGTWNYCRYLGPHLVDQGGGSIVNISSAGSIMTSYYRAPYMASKAGVKGLTMALALDLAERNVRVNAVAPGCVDTGMTRPREKRVGRLTDHTVRALTPMRRWGTVEDVSKAVMFLGIRRRRLHHGPHARRRRRGNRRQPVGPALQDGARGRGRARLGRVGRVDRPPLLLWRGPAVKGRIIG